MNLAFGGVGWLGKKASGLVGRRRLWPCDTTNNPHRAAKLGLGLDCHCSAHWSWALDFAVWGVRSCGGLSRTVMEGKLLLYDVSTWGSSWSHKFFVLENGALSWFASQPPARRGRRSAGTSPEASVVVNQVKLAPSDATSGERAFCVSESEQKYVVLRAETDQDLQRWVSALGFAASASAASASSSSSSAPASLPVSIPSRAPTPLNACGGGGDNLISEMRV